MNLKKLAQNSDWLKSPRHGGSLRRRTFSFFVDLFCILLTTKLLMASYISYLKTFMYLMGERSHTILSSQMHKMEFSVITVVFFGYFFLSYYMSDGRTPGKVLFRLRVVPNENPTALLSLKESLHRTFGYMLCYLSGFVLFALPYFNKDKMGVPDMISHSKVITEAEFEYYMSLEQDEDKKSFEFEQMELNFNIEAEKKIVFLPGPEFFSDTGQDKDKAA